MRNQVQLVSPGESARHGSAVWAILPRCAHPSAGHRLLNAAFILTNISAERSYGTSQPRSGHSITSSCSFSRPGVCGRLLSLSLDLSVVWCDFVFWRIGREYVNFFYWVAVVFLERRYISLSTTLMFNTFLYALFMELNLLLRALWSGKSDGICALVAPIRNCSAITAVLVIYVGWY